MKKLSTNGVKWLKIVHLVVLVLMMGGIICSTLVRATMPLAPFDEVYVTYRMLQGISDNVVRWGAQGLLLTGIAYSIFTNWGFFKHTWVAVKWVAFMAQTVFGIFFIDHWMVKNLALLEAEGTAALTNPVFLQNHALVKYGGMAQIVVIVILVWVSVAKPWRKKAAA
ncbi:MAG TPA: hypothetical protein VNT75_32375 [Symbiobacteriaceae bacterium]|nr:hypothetical protein [Symbiobacteriaceae bacterium]